MLTTDWFHPSTGTLARVSDPRAIQFWDTGHLVSAELRRSRAAISGQPEPACCDDGGFYWDMAILYPPGAMWKDTLPAAAAMEGPVYQIAQNLEHELEAK
jgi:hypothetical protein